MSGGRYENYEVFNQLIGDAKLVSAGDFGDAVSAAHWRRKADIHTRYDDPDHHTLSLYVNGGTEIRRQIGADPLSGGGPGRCCLMPAHVTSDWLVRGEVELLHLYIPTAAWDRAVVETLDIDPSSVMLDEKTFFVDPLIETTVRHAILPLDWHAPADRMTVSSAGQMLLGHLLGQYSTRGQIRLMSRGGLAQGVKRRIVDYIEANLDQPLSLDQLAAQAQLSPFHFARMFRQSVGEAPHRYVLRRRIEKARDLMRAGDMPLAEIAVACGFSSQSHLTTRFVAFTGITPARFRAVTARQL
ncbi:MAG: AraC family transcriptional regulator [Pseudomonadota bacterium]